MEGRKKTAAEMWLEIETEIERDADLPPDTDRYARLGKKICEALEAFPELVTYRRLAQASCGQPN